MKRLKRIMALVITIAMVLGMTSMAAFAAADPTDEPTGSITIVPSDTVTLEKKTLNAYRILDATYGEGTLPTQPVSYTIPAKMQSFYDEYFSNGLSGADKKTATQLAAEAGKTLDLYVVDSIAALTTADIKDFEYAALAAAKEAGVAAAAGTFEEPNYKFTGLPAGYYVIEDEGSGLPISALMLDTVTDADVEIILKAEDKTTKTIMTAGDLINSKANELGLGRAVNFKITQEIPDYTGYDYFYYMINDTLSDGLTFNPDSLVVTIKKPATDAEYAPQSAYADNNAANAAGFQYNTGEAEGSEKYWVKPATAAEDYVLSEENKDYYLYYDNGAEPGDDDYDEETIELLNGKSFIIAFDDIVKNAKTGIGYGVEVTYSATVNSNAVSGVDPNNNKVNVEYSNNPDKDERGDNEEFPGIPANQTDHPTGVGPDKFTDTYTTKVKIVKVDESDNPLPGVEFTLTGTAKDAVFKTEQTFDIDPNGTYWLLKNGKYTTTAPTTEATVSETTGGAGWVEVGADETVAANVPVRVIGDKKYRPYVEATDSAKTRYIINEPNDDDYASITTKYSLSTAKTADAAEQYTVSRSGVTAASTGELAFSQLGEGTYKLSETGILAGYNGIKDIEFTVTCTEPDAEDVITGEEKATWSITTEAPGVTFVEEQDADENGLGTFTITIQNKKGAELPSTGGIGTTIFYVIGAILVLGAGVVLITRRRMDA